MIKKYQDRNINVLDLKILNSNENLCTAEQFLQENYDV